MYCYVMSYKRARLQSRVLSTDVKGKVLRLIQSAEQTKVQKSGILSLCYNPPEFPSKHKKHKIQMQKCFKHKYKKLLTWIFTTQTSQRNVLIPVHYFISKHSLCFCLR